MSDASAQDHGVIQAEKAPEKSSLLHFPHDCSSSLSYACTCTFIYAYVQTSFTTAFFINIFTTQNLATLNSEEKCRLLRRDSPTPC